MPSSIIHNALLRVDGTSEQLPSPFERPNDKFRFWVLELPNQHMSVSNWCIQATQILNAQAELLQRVHRVGGQSTLFVELSATERVFRLESTFLRLLADLDISLEYALTTNA